ncbi:flavodoxin family protein [Candidatus Omnitrophota bacterium]
MRKTVSIVMVLVSMFFFSGLAHAASKVLVVYYSRDGHTKMVAEGLAEKWDATIEGILDLKKREGAIATAKAGTDAVLHKTTDIQFPLNDPFQYDLILIGTPAWFSNMTPAIRTYLTEFDLLEKDVAFFATCHKVGADKATQQMAELVFGKEAKGIPQLPLTHHDLDAERLEGKIETFYASIAPNNAMKEVFNETT